MHVAGGMQSERHYIWIIPEPAVAKIIVVVQASIKGSDISVHKHSLIKFKPSYFSSPHPPEPWAQCELLWWSNVHCQSVCYQSEQHLFLTGLQIKVCNETLFFLFLNQNICCGYSKEPSNWDGSLKHPKHMFKLRDKKIIAISRWKFWLNWPYVLNNISTQTTGWNFTKLHRNYQWMVRFQNCFIISSLICKILAAMVTER